MTRVRPVPPDAERRDLAALAARGVPLTDSLRALLWIAMDWHDVSRDAWAERVVLESPPGGEVETLKAALRAWRDEAESRAARAEAHARHLHDEEGVVHIDL